MSDTGGDPSATPSTGAPDARKAAGCGIGCGLAAAFVVALVAGSILELGDASGLSAIPEFGFVGGLIALGGWGLRAWADKCDRINQARQSAPPLPVRLAAAGQRVWIEGTVVCPHPVAAPEFGMRCAWLHVRIVRGSGKSKKTERDEKQSMRTWIETDGARIEIDLARTAFHQLTTWTKKDGARTLTVSALAVGSRASVCGIVREEPRSSVPANARWDAPGDGAAGRDASGVPDLPATTATDVDYESSGGGIFESGAGSEGDAPGLVIGATPDAPLLVTPLDRLSWCAHVETEEMGFRWAGAAALCVGFGLFALGVGTAAGAWSPDDFVGFLAGAVVGALATCAVLVRGAGAQIAASRRLAEEAAAALETDLVGAESDRDTAAARVEARMKVYDFFAEEHNRTIAAGLGRFVARRRGLAPLPLRGP
jgi:hypothetical protein